MSTVVCLDQKKPYKVSDPHGPWWLTIRVPLGTERHLYIGASTAPRFVPGHHGSGRVLVDTQRLAVLVMPRKFYGGRRLRSWATLQRFCAHVYCAAPEDKEWRAYAREMERQRNAFGEALTRAANGEPAADMAAQAMIALSDGGVS